MANDLTTTDQALGLPVLASLALSRRPWTTEDAVAAVGGDLAPAVVAAVAHIDRAFEPVPPTGAGRADWKVAMDDRLRRLAVKIAPGMAEKPALEWRNVIVDALADLPAMIALTAAKRAIHRPLRFLNEVEHVVREIAAQVAAERRHAKARVEALLAPPAQLTLPPQAEGAPLSADEIRKMPRHLIDMGLAKGWLTQADVDEAPPRPADVAPTAPAPSAAPTHVYAAGRAVTGPQVETGDDCPFCEDGIVCTGGGYAYCNDHERCGKLWQMVAEAA